MEEDIKELLKCKDDYDFAYGTQIHRPYVMSEKDWELIENLLTRYKQQKTELESVKEIYYTQTEMDNVMERYRKLVEENKILKKGIVPSYENTIKELEEQLFDSIPKSKIKEKIEARESSIADIKDNFVINEGMTIEINRLETEIDVLQELLKEK